VTTVCSLYSGDLLLFRFGACVHADVSGNVPDAEHDLVFKAREGWASGPRVAPLAQQVCNRRKCSDEPGLDPSYVPRGTSVLVRNDRILCS
jgi:hypothetical protein